MTNVPGPPDSRRLLMPDEVCEQLGITKRTLYEMVQRGRIEHIKLNNAQLRFRQAQVDAYIDAQVVPMRGQAARLATLLASNPPRAGRM